jgi:hypothetical protein
MTTGEAQHFAQNFTLPVLTNESMRVVMKRSQPKVHPALIECD